MCLCLHIICLSDLLDNLYVQSILPTFTITQQNWYFFNCTRQTRFPIVSLEFFTDIILPAALWPWGQLSLLTEMSTRNISWGVKVAGAWGWQPYHLHVPTVFKSGSLNLLELSGPVQACNGTALPRHITPKRTKALSEPKPPQHSLYFHYSSTFPSLHGTYNHTFSFTFILRLQNPVIWFIHHISYTFGILPLPSPSLSVLMNRLT